MGFLNAMSSINKVNNLLKDLENQVTITQGQINSNAPVYMLENSLNTHKRIHQELINAFSNSGGARVSMYTVFGDKMRMDDILSYSKNLSMNLAAVIAQR